LAGIEFQVNLLAIGSSQEGLWPFMDRGSLRGKTVVTFNYL
jgi:hypothetical protein